HERHPLVHLVQEVRLHTATPPHLAAHVVGALRVLERHIPRGDDLVKADRPTGPVLPLNPLRLVVERPPVPLEDVAFSRRRPPLTQGVPRAGTHLPFTLLPLLNGAATGRLHVLARLATEKISLPFRRVVVGLGGNVDDPPVDAVIALLQPTGEIVMPPAGLDDDDRDIGA